MVLKWKKNEVEMGKGGGVMACVKYGFVFQVPDVDDIRPLDIFQVGTMITEIWLS